MKYISYSLLFLVTLNLLSCTEDTYLTPELSVEEKDKNTPEQAENEEENTPTENLNPVNLPANAATYFNKDLVDDNYILVNDAGNNFVYLMNKDAKILHQWNLNGGDLGNDCYLLENGKLLAMVESDDPKILLGGQGGKVKLLEADGTEYWSFTHSTDDYLIHHDAEMLPNGNILTMTWERYSVENAIEAGYQLEVELFPDGLIEINPNTNEIVWEWKLWNHLIQEVDSSKKNYGIVADNPHLVNINYNLREDGDISHGNGIAYDKEKDVIYLSANFYSEIWVIDHSTTKEEAASHTGGNYGKGGDLLYRFGNPSAYNNTIGERLFINNHFPNLLEGEDKGKMLVFSNGGDTEQSIVYELQIPSTFDIDNNKDNEPQVTWSFNNPDLYSAKVSGAVKLTNGNILITEGDYGIWEVTRNKEVVWKFNSQGFFWRAYHYDKNDSRIQDLLNN